MPTLETLPHQSIGKPKPKNNPQILSLTAKVKKHISSVFQHEVQQQPSNSTAEKDLKRDMEIIEYIRLADDKTLAEAVEAMVKKHPPLSQKQVEDIFIREAKKQLAPHLPRHIYSWPLSIAGLFKNQHKISSTLQSNPSAKLSFNKETDEYFQRMTNMEPAYLAEVLHYSKHLPPMNPKCKMTICIPVAAHEEGANIINTLELYSHQSTPSENFEVLLFLNRPANKPDITTPLVREFCKKNNKIKIHYVTKVFNQTKGEVFSIGICRRYMGDITLARARERNTKNGLSDREHLITTNDADLKDISPEYSSRIFRYFQEHPNKDCAVGRIDWDREMFRQYPNIYLTCRFQQYINYHNRNKRKTVISTSGANSVYKASTYAALGGVPYSNYYGHGEDTTFGDMIQILRHGNGTNEQILKITQRRQDIIVMIEYLRDVPYASLGKGVEKVKLKITSFLESQANTISAEKDNTTKKKESIRKEWHRINDSLKENRRALENFSLFKTREDLYREYKDLVAKHSTLTAGSPARGIIIAKVKGVNRKIRDLNTKLGGFSPSEITRKKLLKENDRLYSEFIGIDAQFHSIDSDLVLLDELHHRIHGMRATMDNKPFSEEQYKRMQTKLTSYFNLYDANFRGMFRQQYCNGFNNSAWLITDGRRSIDTFKRGKTHFEQWEKFLKGIRTQDQMNDGMLKDFTYEQVLSDNASLLKFKDRLEKDLLFNMARWSYFRNKPLMQSALHFIGLRDKDSKDGKKKANFRYVPISPERKKYLESRNEKKYLNVDIENMIEITDINDILRTVKKFRDKKIKQGSTGKVV